MPRMIVGAGRVQHKVDRYLPAEKTQKQRAEAEARSKSTRGEESEERARFKEATAYLYPKFDSMFSPGLVESISATA